MKTIDSRKLVTAIFFVGISIGLAAQTCTVTPPVCVPVNGYAFQYAPNTNYGLLFNTATSQYQFTDGTGAGIFHINAVNGLVSVDNRLAVGIGNPGATDFSVFNGVAQFGTPAGFAEFQTDGDLIFVGSADYMVGADRYAFRYSLAPGYGLFFNATGAQYEFRTINGSPVFMIDANSGDLSSVGDLDVSGDATVAGDITSGNNITAVGSMSVGSDVSISGNVAVSGVIDIGGNFTTGGNIDALTGDLGVSDVNASGDVTVGGVMSVAGNISSASNLSATGDLSLGGNAIFGGNVDVSGDLSATDLSTTTGDVTTNNLLASGNLTASGSATIGGQLSVSGNILTSNDLFVSGNMSLGGDLSALSGSLSIVDVIASGKIEANGGSAPGSYAVKGISGNPLTNGYLGIAGSGGFDGEDSLEIDGWDVGVLGVSTGATTVDNIGVMGFADFVGVAARHKFSGNAADLATDLYSIYAEGPAEISGDVGINFPPMPGIDLRLGMEHGILQLGATVLLTDAAPFNLSINSQIDPASHLLQDIGSLSLAWNQVFASGFITVSDRRVKKKIESLSYGLDEVMALKPVSYILKEDPKERVKLGFIAQEAMHVIPESVVRSNMIMNAEGRMENVELSRMGMDYSAMIPVLINAMQEQQRMIEEMQTTMEKQNDILCNVDELMEEMVVLHSKLELCCEKEIGEKNEEFDLLPVLKTPWLGQNVPNPFESKTTISYFVPEEFESAEIRIYQIDGKTIEVIEVNQGYGSVIFTYPQTSTLMYSLLCDGEVVRTKKMVIKRK